MRCKMSHLIVSETVKIKYIFFLMLTPLFLTAQKEDQHPGKANRYMHRSSTENLIRHFESEERDAYQKPAEIIEYIGPLQGKTVMDLGAGSGYFSVRLARAGAKVIAADVDDDFLAFVKNRIEKEDLSEYIETRKLPYDSPLLKEHEVDKVLLVNTYHHIENRPDYFKKVLAGLKVDGELIIIDYFKKDLPVGPPRDHKISMPQVISELEQSGYTHINQNTQLLPYQYIIRAKQ